MTAIATVLIVDDDPITALVLERVFERNGYRARSIRSGTECIRRLAAESPPDVILMDINLGPDSLDGPATTRELHRFCDVPVVLHSAYTDRDTMARTREMTQYGFVYKTPGNEQVVLSAVATALKLHGTEKTLAQQQQMYRRLSQQLLRLREEHSAYLAREIHDDLGQSMAALKMNLSVIARTLAGCAPEQRSELQLIASDMQRILDTAIAKLRFLLQDLRPTVLDNSDIVEALRRHLQEFERSFEVPTSFESELESLSLDDEHSLSLFRIVQEALTNSARHASAGRITVRIQSSENTLTVVVEDDGVGFVADKQTAGETLGLLSMRERAAGLGGELRLESRPGGGARVTVHLPLPLPRRRPRPRPLPQGAISHERGRSASESYR